MKLESRVIEERLKKKRQKPSAFYDRCQPSAGPRYIAGNVLNLGKLFPSHGLLGFKHGKFPSAGK